MPLYEIASAPASQAYLDNPEILDAGLKWLSKVSGCIKQWTGLKIEDNTTLYHIVEWESLEHLKAVSALPFFSDYLALLKPCVVGEYKLYHVSLDEPADGTLSAPVTEICISRIKDLKSKDELVALEKTLGSKLTKGEGAFGPAPIGTTMEEEGTLVLFIGWDSVERHVKAVENEEGVKKMLSLSDLEVFHVNFKQYASSA